MASPNLSYDLSSSGRRADLYAGTAGPQDAPQKDFVQNRGGLIKPPIKPFLEDFKRQMVRQIL